MSAPEYCTEITVHFLNGRNESYTVYGSTENGCLQDFQAQMQTMLEQNWWILHLSDQTIVLNMGNVTKLEIKPGMPDLEGKGVLQKVDRLTALRQGRKVMSTLSDIDQ